MTLTPNIVKELDDLCSEADNLVEKAQKNTNNSLIFSSGGILDQKEYLGSLGHEKSRLELFEDKFLQDFAENL